MFSADLYYRVFLVYFFMMDRCLVVIFSTFRSFLVGYLISYAFGCVDGLDLASVQ